jgi:hypothetical protein
MHNGGQSGRDALVIPAVREDRREADSRNVKRGASVERRNDCVEGINSVGENPKGGTSMKQGWAYWGGGNRQEGEKP